MLEAENNISPVDAEKITVENFEELSRNADELLSAAKYIGEDEEETIGDNEC